MSAWMDQFSKILTLISLAIATTAAWYALPLDAQLKALQAETVRLDNALKLSDAEMKRLESSRALSLQLYQEVKAVLSAKEHNAREEEAMRVLVDSLAEDPFRWKLLQAIAVAAGDPTVKQKAEASATFFKEEELAPAVSLSSAKVANPDKPYGAIRVDAFYCADNSGTGKAKAESTLRLRESNSAASWRVRALPDEINARPGYHIEQNLIRYNPDERQAAEALQADLKKSLGIDVALAEIQYPTPNYLSVFYCQRN
ncbi:hypothetical protein HPT27_14540 [Permianibacter sp. IMCC34836]|uniref:hypothetical protein n=1 Tax=Permianibacter fluminis TaxID=2738515 RepID=UPI0015552A9A|nr:hypothetical protein [Permianibacter fluminis]NQD38243.1 hypothetical protein [Permianibacter fluminis]